MKSIFRKLGIPTLALIFALFSLGTVCGFELLRQKNVATSIRFPIVYSNNGSLVTGAAGLDSEISYQDTETGTPSNWTDATNEATEVQSSGQYWLNMTAGELNHLYVWVQVKSSTTNATTQTIPIRTIVGNPANSAVTDDGGAINVNSGVAEANVLQVDGAALSTHQAGHFPVDLRYIAGSILSATSAQIGVNLVNIAGSAVNTSSAQLGVNVVNAGGTAWASGAITAACFASGAINAAAIATDAIGAAELATDAATEIVTATWNALTSGMSTAGSIGKRIVDYLTGDIYARLGAPAGASVSADIAAVKSDTAAVLTDTNAMDTSAELRTLLCGSDTAISTYAGADTSGTTTLLSRLSAARAGYLDYLDVAISSRATNAGVWDLATSGHTTSGTFGAAMVAAGSAGDPWSTSLPGAYGAGTAGYILGTFLNATVSSRSTYAGADPSGVTTLLSRLSETRAGYIDYLASVYAKLPTNYIMGAGSQTDKDDDIDAILTDTAAMDTANELRTLLTGGTGVLSTYAGTDTSGVTTLLTRLSAARAGNLDYLDAAVTSRMATFSLPTYFSSLIISAGGKVTVGTNDDKTGYTISGAAAGDYGEINNDITKQTTVY